MGLQFTCDVSQGDMYAANKRLFRNSWSPVRILLSWIFFLGMFLTVRVARNPAELDEICGCNDSFFELKVAALFAAAYLTLFLAIGWFSLRKQSATLHAQNGTQELHTTYDLTVDRFRYRFDEGSGDHPWERLSEWMDGGTVILLLRRAAGQQFIIPKRCLSEQQHDDLIALLASVGVKGN